jgi:citronellol/citronellal dehydrogenase
MRHEHVHAGMSAELALHGVAVNSLWPRTTIAAAIEMNFPRRWWKASRNRRSWPTGMRDSTATAAATGNFYIDEAVLREDGVGISTSGGDAGQRLCRPVLD